MMTELRRAFISLMLTVVALSFPITFARWIIALGKLNDSHGLPFIWVAAHALATSWCAWRLYLHYSAEEEAY
jgi:hypothetical protein